MLTPVLVVAASLVTRAGLRTLVDDMAAFEVSAAVSPSALPRLAEQPAEQRPGIILWQLAPDEDVSSYLELLDGQPVLLLADGPAAELIRAGARGVLPVNSSEEQIRMALEAVAAGLVVMTPENLLPTPEAATSRLTARETEVLRMISEGLVNKEIAWRLGISEHTVKFHVSALLGKLNASSRAEAVSTGMRQGLLMI